MKRIVCVLKTNEGGIWAVPQLEELRQRGDLVTVVIPSGDGKLRRLLDDRGIPVAETNFDFSFRPSFRLLRGLWNLRRQLRALRPDTVFYHLFASALAVRFATLFLPVRKVHMVAGPLYLDSTLIRRFESLLCRMDDVIIGGSEHIARRYRGIGMPADRIIAIPYGVDLRRFSRSTVSAPTMTEESKFRVVMVAYVYAPKSMVYPGVGIKGHETLLEAWVRFVDEFPESELVMVGAGFDEAGEAHREVLMARSRNLRSTVRWVDSVSDVRPWYVASDVSVSPSLSENHGAALEAAAMQCPSIVSTAGALPETVISGVSGFVFPAGDVDALLDSLRKAHAAKVEGVLTEMGEAAREHMLREFDQSNCSSRVADVVQSL